MSNPQASPVEVKINDTTYRMAPLTDKLIGELNNFVREKVVTLAVNAAREMSLADGNKLVDRALMTAGKLDFMLDPSIAEEPENALHIIFLAFRKEQPSLNKDDFLKDMMDDPEALDRCAAAFKMLQPMGNSEEARTPNPTQSQNQRQGSGQNQKMITSEHSRKQKKSKRQNKNQNRNRRR